MISETMVYSGGMYRKHIEYTDPKPQGTKALRALEVWSQVVEVDGVRFNADELSMDRMDRVLSIAGWKFNQAISQGVPAGAAYTAIYETTLPWVSADNIKLNVNVETLARVQEIALAKLGETWVKYVKD